jgi:hypothetical protein
MEGHAQRLNEGIVSVSQLQLEKYTDESLLPDLLKDVEV